MYVCLFWGVSALRGGLLRRGGVCSRGCLLLGGCVCLLLGGFAPGGCLLWWGGVWSGGCVCCWRRCVFSGGCLLPGVSALGGWYPSMHWGRHPTPPVNRMTNSSKNITLATTSLRPVKMSHTNRTILVAGTRAGRWSSGTRGTLSSVCSRRRVERWRSTRMRTLEPAPTTSRVCGPITTSQPPDTVRV